MPVLIPIRSLGFILGPFRSRLVARISCTGTPMADSLYARHWVPEFSRNESYCPFRLNMWQFGSDLQQYFPVRFSSFKFDEDEF